MSMSFVHSNAFFKSNSQIRIFSTRYSVMCKVYIGYHGTCTSKTERGLCACTVDNPDYLSLQAHKPCSISHMYHSDRIKYTSVNFVYHYQIDICVTDTFDSIKQTEKTVNWVL